MFVNLSGNSEIPKSFTFTYSTLLSEPVVASYDGTHYTNCTAIEGGIIANFFDPSFNTGRLKVHRVMTLTDGGDGNERQVTESKELDCYVVQSLSEPHKIAPTSATNSHYDGFEINETVEFDIKEGKQGEPGPQGIQGMEGIEGIQGEQGNQGTQGTQGAQGVEGEQGVQGEQGNDASIDYSVTTEEETPNWYCDMDGVRKKVYKKTFLGTIPQGGGTVRLYIGQSAILLSLTGYIETIGRGNTAENIPMHFGGEYEWKYYKWGPEIDIMVPPTSTELFARPYTMVLQYVK